MVKYDVIIVGAGPAGLTAGIYTSRRALKTLIISRGLGGQAALAFTVENYPGYLAINGFELMKKFEEQAKKFGVEFIYDEVLDIKPKDKVYVVKTRNKEFEAKAVILASGKIPRKLDVHGEEKFDGKGISYCATCDLPMFKNKTIAVVGGGNSALDAALYGSEIAKRVYLIHRRDQFRGFESLVREVKKKKNIELVLSSVVTEFKGDKFLKSVVVKNVATGKSKEIPVDGCFIEIGWVVQTDWLRDLVKLDENGQIVINQNCETYYPDGSAVRPGIFAAGDVTTVPFKQIVVSAGEGSKAALQAYNYLHGVLPAFSADWAKLKR
jgi:thioredoxin reductase (NADPH)